MDVLLAGADASPSPWVRRFTPLVAPSARVLDVGCGSGRHLRWFYGRGHPVTGVDVAPDHFTALAPLRANGAGETSADIELLQADLEADAWPLAGRQFGAVVVTRYLHRPLLPTIAASVAPGGVLLYETFAEGQETLGRPRRPDFLLRPGELLALCAGHAWRVMAYEHGVADQPEHFVQRIAAVRLARNHDTAGAPARHPLAAR